MPLKRSIVSLLVAAFAGQAAADIVWKGRKLEAWPAEALHPTARVSVGDASTSEAAAVALAGHYPSPKGKVYGLTLLVDFSDAPAPFTKDEISDWLNKPGFDRDGCKGSVRDFYLDVSNGQVDFTNEVFGWYRAKHPKSYYEGLPDYSGSDELLGEMLASFDPQVDFSRYDNDKDGTTEAISIVYAGAGKTWGQGLWPHSGWVGKTFDKTSLDRYQMSDMPGKFSLYVFVHECGHMIFGWPDLYWYGDYCTMGNRASDLNPVAINDFFRADQGWIPFQEVTATDTQLVTTADGETVYRYRNPRRPDREGFAWSFLKNTARRSVIRGSGLLVHHYDFSIDGNSSAKSLGLRIVQADGLEELQAAQWPTVSNDPKDLFQSGTVGNFDDLRFDALRWYDGKSSGISVSGIGAPGTALVFRMGPSLPGALASSRLEAEKAQVVAGVVKSTQAASAGAYVSTLDHAESKVVFTVNRPLAGRCTLLVRYANGGTRDASQTIAINGSLDSVLFRPTGAWARFDSVAMVVDLRQGRNQIVLGKKADIVELDAISLGATSGSSAVATAPAPGAFPLRRIGARSVEAPMWMAGQTVEFFEPTGRRLGRTTLALADGRAVGELPRSRPGILLWRVDGGEASRRGGILLP